MGCCCWGGATSGMLTEGRRTGALKNEVNKFWDLGLSSQRCITAERRIRGHEPVGALPLKYMLPLTVASTARQGHTRTNISLVGLRNPPDFDAGGSPTLPLLSM